MTKGLLFSFLFHSLIIFLTMLTLPFMMREPIDLPPIVSVELIEIKDKTYIPFAPKARKIIKEVKEEKKRIVVDSCSYNVFFCGTRFLKCQWYIPRPLFIIGHGNLGTRKK